MKFNGHKSFFNHGITLISLHCTILLEANFQSHSIQTPLSAFTHPSQVTWITIPRSSSLSNLVYTLSGMNPTPHAVMPRSGKMWLEANFTTASLSTSCVYCKSTYNLSHSKSACLLALAIAFSSLRRNWARRLFKTYAFIVVWSWCLGASFQVDWRLGLPNSITTLWRAHKCHIKLYLAV